MALSIEVRKGVGEGEETMILPSSPATAFGGYGVLHIFVCRDEMSPA